MSLEATASEAMGSPHLFGPFFEGSSWETWRAVVKASFAEPLSDAERELFQTVANREPPAERVRELVVAAGRGAGKDSAASFLAAFIAITFEGRSRLRPGERAYVLCLAVDKSQAAIAFRYVAGYFERISALASMVSNVGPATIDLCNGVTIEVVANNFRSVRGRSLLAVILDEAAFFRDEAYANPDVETYNAVAPGLARVQGSMLLIISSVHKRNGLLYKKIRDYYGKNDPNTLAVLGSTLDFNPSFDKRIIDRALEEDPERYGAEYLSRWRDDLSTFIDRVLLDAAVDMGVIVRPPSDGVHYVAGCDASGGRNDSFTAAIAHREQDGRIVLDVSFERKAPFNPSEVVGEVVQLMKEYRCCEVVGDHYGANWTVESFAKAGAKYIQSDRDRSAVYMDTLPIFTSGQARLLDNQKLISQFASLERRTFSTGRERIDPGPGHDDVCNSAAIALSLVAGKKGPMKFHTPHISYAPRLSPDVGPLPVSMADGGGYVSAPPGGWPSGSPQAAAAGPFAHLSWTPKRR